MDKNSELISLVKNMNPILNEGVYVFCVTSEWQPHLAKLALCHFKEKEGVTLVLEKEIADQQKLQYEFEANWITLQVNSALNAIGLTAVVSQKLTEKGISCNVIAGFYHDHIFVPSELGSQALTSLEDLSKGQ
jgi:uncharacterized protein